MVYADQMEKGYFQSYIGWIPRNLKIFIFKPKLPFSWEIQKMTGVRIRVTTRYVLGFL